MTDIDIERLADAVARHLQPGLELAVKGAVTALIAGLIASQLEETALHLRNIQERLEI